ncbi:hypothetical protein [Caballeronia sp. 15711]|uniref:hypothetical protein n=1 Tax=Caballeronia sp. 15711 TaxID=3391029 RepID=UPI0039E5E61F
MAVGSGARIAAAASGCCADEDAGNTCDVDTAAWICLDDFNRSAAGALQASSIATFGTAGLLQASSTTRLGAA